VRFSRFQKAANAYRVYINRHHLLRYAHLHFLLTKVTKLENDSRPVRLSKRGNPKALDSGDLHTTFITHASIITFDTSTRPHDLASTAYKTFRYRQLRRGASAGCLA